MTTALDATVRLDRKIEASIAPISKPKHGRPSRQDRKRDAENKTQIAARVAPEAPKRNEIKKVYKEGSPGFARKLAGVTLSAIKASINEKDARVTVMLDTFGQPTGESTTVMVRNTAACTLRRRKYTERGLLGASSKTSKQRRKNNRVSAVGTKGTKPSKKNSAKGAPVTTPKAVRK